MGIDIWVAVLDVATCSRCRVLHGKLFDHRSGPRPPLHSYCRCKRVFYAWGRDKPKKPKDPKYPWPWPNPYPRPPLPPDEEPEEE